MKSPFSASPAFPVVVTRPFLSLGSGMWYLCVSYHFLRAAIISAFCSNVSYDPTNVAKWWIMSCISPLGDTLIRYFNALIDPLSIECMYYLLNYMFLFI